MSDQMREALLKIRQIANGDGHPRLKIAKIYGIATRASRLDASIVVADMKQCPSVNAYVADYEYRGDQDYKPNEHEQAMIEDAIEGYIAERALAAPQPAAPSDFERAFTDACDEIGCPHDNEALLQAIADLKKPAAPLGGRAAVIEECAKVADEAKLAAHIHHGVDASIGADIAARRIRALTGNQLPP